MNYIQLLNAIKPGYRMASRIAKHSSYLCTKTYLILVLLLSLLPLNTAFAEFRDSASGEYRYDLTLDIPVAAGNNSSATFMLDASLFTPITEVEDALYPTIVMPTSWASPLLEYYPIAIRLVKLGYQVLIYTPRGFYGSGGKDSRVEVASENDINDISTLIDWLIANQPTNPDAIGMTGISYGAGLSLKAAAFDERIRSVVSMSGWGNLTDSLAPALSPRMDYIDLLNIAGWITGRRSQELIDNVSNIRTLSNIPDVIEWAEARSPINFWDKVNSRVEPLSVYAINNYQDELFQPDSMVDLLSTHEGPKRFDTQFGPHAAGEVISQVNPFDYTWNKTIEWFDHYLKGEINGVQCLNKINLYTQSRLEDTPKREGYEDFPENDANNNFDFYLHPNNDNTTGTLETSQYSGAAREMTFNTKEAVVENGWLIEHIIAHRQWDVNNFDGNSGLVFKAPITENMYLRGSAKLTLSAKTQYASQYFAYLMQYDPETGKTNWLAHSSFTNVPRDGSQPTTTSQQEIELQFLFTVQDIKAGNELVLVIDGSDGVFLSPPNKPEINRLNFSQNIEAKLTLPLVAEPQAQKRHPLFFGPLRCDNDISEATRAKLGIVSRNAPPAAEAENQPSLIGSLFNWFFGLFS